MKKTSNSQIGYVKLELLRPGPAHNQLISPLTPYIALCGADGPVTVRMPFEHRQLLMRLRRLRYPAGVDPATDEQRQAEVRDIGESIGSVLGQVPALLAELGNACVESGKLVHLRLALSGFELGMIPFEAAIAPDGFPGSGSPLFLQMRTPISITREIRRGRPLPVEWNRPPKILFAFAAPDGLYVPAQTHLQALREAIEPWVKIKDKDSDRLPEIKNLLTVLPDASLEKIRKECAANEYTHVHILAHGAPFKNSGEDHYGVALCNEYDQTADIVDGERLAIALTAHDSSGMARFRPTIVTLTTCDSGNIETVLTPGGSIAHELNAAGIPWVIASQFPLWMRASAIAADVLYKGLLSGKDPRWVLYDLRQRLRTDSPGTHDWASIVAYSTVPWDFEKQVYSFRDKQTRKKLEVKFARIDDLLGVNNKGEPSKALEDLEISRKTELDNLRDSIRVDLKKWRDELDTSSSPKEIAERFGVSAANEKRIGIAYFWANQESESQKAYEASRDFYQDALEADPTNHWAITQYLSILAVLKQANTDVDIGDLRKQYKNTWVAAYQIAQWQYRNAAGDDRVWALGTLAELALLSSVYLEQSDAERKLAKAEIKRYCKEMRELVDENAFPLFSTKRQFRRYLSYWKRDEWSEFAKEALRALGDKGT
ncbi:MAG: CHAT domain-containing protein [Methylobacter sp.]